MLTIIPSTLFLYYWGWLNIQAKMVAKGSSAFDLKPGMRGFFITCFKNREAVTTKEAYALLENKYAQEESENEAEGLSVEDALKKEVEGLKDRREKTFLSVRMHQVPCMIFIASKHDSKPSELLEKLEAPATRYIQRMIPVDAMCHANIKDIQTSLTPLLQEAFTNDKNSGATYAIIVEQRMNNSIKKGVLIELIGEMVGGRARVDLKQPTLVIMVQIVKNVAGLSVIRDYYERNKLNLSIQK